MCFSTCGTGKIVTYIIFWIVEKGNKWPRLFIFSSETYWIVNSFEGRCCFIGIYIPDQTWCLASLHSCWVTSVVSDSLRPCGPWPARLLCPWDSPDKSTGGAAMSSFRRSSEPASLRSPALAGRFFTTSAVWEALCYLRCSIVISCLVSISKRSVECNHILCIVLGLYVRTGIVLFFSLLQTSNL